MISRCPFFPRLALRSVSVTSRAGRVFSVPLLPVRELSTLFRILESASVENVASIVQARADLRALIAPVLRKPLRRDLMYLDYQSTAKLALALFFGDSTPPDEGAADNGGGTDGRGDIRKLDLEFQAARILNVFSGYTVKSLLEEPTPVFLALMALAARIRKDEAVETVIPAVSVVLSGEGYEDLCALRGNLEKQNADTRKASPAYSDAQYSDAVARMSQKLTVTRSVTRSDIIGKNYRSVKNV